MLTNLEVTREGNYYVEVNMLYTYDLKGAPVCGNCLVPIFPVHFWLSCADEASCTRAEEHYGLTWHWSFNTRGTDEPAECDECVAAIDEGIAGCEDDCCDDCMAAGMAAYEARTKSVYQQKEEHMAKTIRHTYRGDDPSSCQLCNKSKEEHSLFQMVVCDCGPDCPDDCSCCLQATGENEEESNG